MTVHLVGAGQYSDFHLVGVFSTKEKAETFVINNATGDDYDDPFYIGENEVDGLYSEVSDPIFYYTEFNLYAGGDSHDFNFTVSVDEDYNFNIPSTFYKSTGFEMKKNRGDYYGHIITAEAYDKDKLLKIIRDRAYEEISKNLMIV